MSHTAGAVDLYSQSLIDELRARVGPKVESTVHQDIARLLPAEVRPKVARIDVRIVDRGRHPMDIAAMPSRNAIYVPIETIRFLDETTILNNWFRIKQCDFGYVASYFTGLLERKDLAAGPLAAFHIDRDRALAIPDVDDVSLKEHQTIVFFALAHEVAHVLFGHFAPADPATSQRQEIEADQFALDLFGAMGQAPWGLATYFSTTLWLEPVDKPAMLMSHPLSHARLKAISARLKSDADAFAGREFDLQVGRQQVLAVGDRMAQMASLMQEGQGFPVMRAGIAQAFPPASFASACP